MHIAILLWLSIQNIRKKSWLMLPQTFGGVLYTLFFNFIYYYLCRYKLLWEFKSKIFKVTTLRAIHLFLIMPLFIQSFLSTYPKRWPQNFFYILKWVGTSSLVEAIAQRKGYIKFCHGWNGFWSGAIYLCMFIFSRLVMIRPYFTLFLSSIFSFILVKIFRIPLKRRFMRKNLWESFFGK